MLKAFDTALYASTSAALVTLGGKFGEAATAHAPVVLVGLLEGSITEETYLATLCAKAGVLSSKGKANANALETNGFGAVKRVYTDIKRIAAHLSVPGVREAVEGFARYMPDYEVPEVDEALEGAELAKARAAVTRTINRDVAERFPNRPTSFAALVKEVTRCINKQAKADAEADGEETTDADAPTPTAPDLNAVLDMLRSIDAPVDADLLAEIAAEVDRIANIEADAEEIAEAA